MIRSRIHFIDGSQGHFDDVEILGDYMWIKGTDTESHNVTFVPSARIHKIVGLGECNTK